MMRQLRTTRRGTVMVIALWATAISAIVASAIMLYAFRTASYGREALGRVQARWAARAGVENMISVMAEHNLQPIPEDAFAMIRDMDYYSTGELLNATYDIRHHRDGVNWSGPLDEHSKLHVNDQSNLGYIYLLNDMTPDVADAITDWMDEDDEISTFGVERDYYLGLPTPYEPRNGLMRSTAEMELIAGIWPEYLRGEDWNMNGRLDPNENDGDISPPEDEPDGILNPTWGMLLTTYSRKGGYGMVTGLEAMNLRFADAEELQERLQIDERQAEALRVFASNDQNSIEMLLTSSLADLSGIPTIEDDPENGMRSLNEEQLRMVFAECTMDDPLEGPMPGKLNINTVSADLLRQMFSDESTERLVDEVLYLRNNRAEGVVSPVDLRDIPNLDSGSLERLASLFDVRSNVFLVSSKGRCSSSGLEVEIVAIVDRSTLPVRILEYREQ
ncbi:MAG: hypothetical protein AAF432_04735 [Planctomycetota bacterium]